MSQFDDLVQRVADLERRLNDTVVEGVVVAVQAKPYRVRVNYGTQEAPQLSNWLPVAVDRAASAKVWWPLEVGEGVTVLSVNGYLERGRVFRGRYTLDNPPPSDDLELFLVQFGDGGFYQYHRGTGVGTIKAIKQLVLDSDVQVTKNLSVANNTSIGGNADIAGTSKAADHDSGGKSGKNHTHRGDSGGSTSTPQ